MGWISVLTTPLSFIFGVTISILSYLLAPLLFIASPVIYIGQSVLYLTLLPLRIIIKLEAFIYFITGAILIGATTGMILHFTGRTISQVLNIEEPDEKPRRRVKRESLDSTPEDPPFEFLRAKMEDTKYFSNSTILEEDESSQYSE